MNCEICGKEIQRGAISVKIEGTVMTTCRACAKHGEHVYERKPITKSRPTVRTPVHRSEKIIELVEDYSKLVRKNREQMGLTQDQVGAKINEKGSVISRIESGHMEPNIKLAKKLEKLFSITLLEEQES